MKIIKIVHKTAKVQVSVSEVRSGYFGTQWVTLKFRRRKVDNLVSQDLHQLSLIFPQLCELVLSRSWDDLGPKEREYAFIDRSQIASSKHLMASKPREIS